MKYIANPVVVDAFQIIGLDDCVGMRETPVDVLLEDGRTVEADPEMLARMTPQIGDYWVVQSDGYTYLNPKEVFERKYSPLHIDKPTPEDFRKLLASGRKAAVNPDGSLDIEP
jgi:hypothetical protein